MCRTSNKGTNVCRQHKWVGGGAEQGRVNEKRTRGRTKKGWEAASGRGWALGRNMEAPSSLRCEILAERQIEKDVAMTRLKKPRIGLGSR